MKAVSGERFPRRPVDERGAEGAKRLIGRTTGFVDRASLQAVVLVQQGKTMCLEIRVVEGS